MNLATIRSATKIAPRTWQLEVDRGGTLSVDQRLQLRRGEEDLTTWVVLISEGASLVVEPYLDEDVSEPMPGDHLDFHVGGMGTHFGLGDVIARMTSAVGIPPCPSCEERRKKLNAIAPRVLRRR